MFSGNCTTVKLKFNYKQNENNFKKGQYNNKPYETLIAQKN